MANRYFFDKRDMKRGLFKYLIIFLISFIPIVLINTWLSNVINKRWLIIFIDCIILLVFVFIGSIIANKIFEKRDRKRDARIREREAMEERKRIILEESYARKREEKINKKINENTEIITEEPKKKSRRK